MRRGLIWLLLALGVLLMALGVVRLWQDMGAGRRYHELADEVGLENQEDDPARALDAANGSSGIDLDALPSNAVAWVRVDGTSIDLPVASGGRGFSWYLHHDLWGNPTELGCPFVDPRCSSADDAHVLAYGHHVSLSGVMFSSLHRCYLQGTFDTLGTCTWTTREGQTVLSPLCALSVDQNWGDILRFSFGNDSDLQAWVLGIVRQSSAITPDAEQQAIEAHRIVTLVTCSSEVSGQRWRTLVLFSA